MLIYVDCHCIPWFLMTLVWYLFIEISRIHVCFLSRDKFYEIKENKAIVSDNLNIVVV